MRFFLILLFPIFGFANAAITMQKNDPYAVNLGKPTHALDVRIYQHGLKNRESYIAEQIQHTETLLSQCPGTVVKVNVLSIQKLSSSTAQEKIIEFKNNKMVYRKDFLKFIKPFASDRRDGPMNLHLTEYMNEEIRKTKVLNGQITYGQAFNYTSVGKIFHDPRSVNDQKPPLHDLVANSLFLALETVALHRKTSLKYPQYESHPRDYSLLAHEIGHLLLEGFDPSTNTYHDHWCPVANDFCDRGYLMSSGGNSDAYYTDRTTGSLVGYDLLPKLDSIQCEKLRTSKYLRRL